MSDQLYELTRRLVALGCPEVDGLEYAPMPAFHDWSNIGGDDVPDHHARAIWEAHAREWAAKEKRVHFAYDGAWTIQLGDHLLYRGHDLLDGIATVLG